MRTILAMALTLTMGIVSGACREKPSEQECKVMATKRANVYFGTRNKKMSKMANKKAKKLEYQASMEECMDAWTKQEAQCVAKAKNRDDLTSCR